MKKIVLILVVLGSLLACTKSEVENLSTGAGGCTYNGNRLYDGPKGGCYYKNSNGNKMYVDRSYCSCK
ncbi:hypothetical protein ACR78F_00080 [Sphingobacterium spiritivorum]